MLVPDRRRLVLDRVRATGSAQVDHLALAAQVSPSTIRRDLRDLEATGLLRRTRGGAYLPGGTAAVPGADPIRDSGLAAKQRIGKGAADLLADGMTVLVLAGSTTSAMLPFLAGRRLTVVTNGLDIAHRLATGSDLDVIVLGGMLHREQHTLLGPMTDQAMASLHVDVIVAGAYGIDPDVGVTGNKISQAGNPHTALRHADSLVVLADGSKFGRRGPTVLAQVGQVDTFVTDSSAPAEHLDRLRGHGAAVLVC